MMLISLFSKSASYFKPFINNKKIIKKNSSIPCNANVVKNCDNLPQPKQSPDIKAPILPYLQIAIGAIMVSFSAVFVKLTTTGPATDAFYRMFFGGIILLILALVRKEKCWISGKPLGFIIFTGFAFAVDLTFWHRCVDAVGPGLATIIVNLQVFIIAFIGIYYQKEKCTRYFFAALPLAMFGMYLLVGHNWQRLTDDYKFGIYFGFIATLCYSIYIFCLHKTRTQTPNLPVFANLALVSLSSAFFLIFICHFTHENIFGFTNLDLVWLVFYGIFGQVLGWLLISLGMSKAKLSIAGFVLLLQPALAFIWDIIIFHRSTAIIEIAGSAITLFAIYLSSVANR